MNPKRLDQKTGSSKNKMERQSHQAADRTPLCPVLTVNTNPDDDDDDDDDDFSS